MDKVRRGCYIETRGLSDEVVRKIEEVFVGKFGEIQGARCGTKLFAGTDDGIKPFYHRTSLEEEYEVTVEDVLGAIEKEDEGMWKEITKEDIVNLKKGTQMRVQGYDCFFRADDGDGEFYVEGALPDDSPYMSVTDWEKWTVEIWVEEPETLEFKTMKFRVDNEEHSRQIQEALFDLGYSWYGGVESVQYTYNEFLYVWEDGSIRYGNDEDVFHKVKSSECYIEPVTKYEIKEVPVPAKKMTHAEIEEALGYKVEITG